MPRLFPAVEQISESDICRQYRVLCGIEEEFLLINKNGSLAQRADNTMLAAADILRNDQKRLRRLRLKIRALDPEPSLAQIEYTTLPTAPSNIKDYVTEGRRLIADAARSADSLTLAQSMHPFESNPNPMAGTHINVSVRRGDRLMTPEEQLLVYNHCWNHLPELLALSVNSPLLRGKETGVASNRNANSRVLRRNPFAILKIPEKQSQLVQQSYYGRLRYTLKIGSDETEPLLIMNPQGNRMTDITARGPHTNIDQDRDETPYRNRVEIRIFDVQVEYLRLVDISYLCCALALQATSCLGDSFSIQQDPYHDENVEQAIQFGLNATFRTSNGPVDANKAVGDLIDSLRFYLNLLEVDYQTDLLNSVTKKDPLTPFSAPKMTTFAKLNRQGKQYLLIKTGKSRVAEDPRTGRRYEVPRAADLFGTLRIRHQLQLDKEPEFGMISGFKDADSTYYLMVRGIPVPLDAKDSIQRAMTEEEYTLGRFLGHF